jgi:hypothetical protein
MRAIFERWGLPERIRVDNGAPWGSNGSDLPPALSLWWVGLGVTPIWNHPHCPKENAFVERCNGLVDTWAEPGACEDWPSWQQKVAWMQQMQREVYPSIGGKSRLEAYPGLREKPRPYTIEKEGNLFSTERVRAYLAEGRWPRLVSKSGQITLYGRVYRVGRTYAGQQVFVHLDPQTNEWVVQSRDGTVLIRHRAEQITTEAICNLQVAHKKPRNRPIRQQNSMAHPPT